MKNKTRGSSAVEVIIWIVILAITVLGPIGCAGCRGAGGFGPTKTVSNVTVIDKHVDRSNDSSHYMVTTDKGVFEVDNGILLGIWNSDEVFGSIEKGKVYNFITEGNKNTNFLFQDYPYITSVFEVK